jgi:hypothetical protein
MSDNRNDTQPPEMRQRLVAKRLLAFFALVAAGGVILGSLAAFRVPVYLILSVIAFIIFLCAAAKFFRDNRRLAQQVGVARLIRVNLKALLVYIPIFLILAPGIWVCIEISKTTNHLTQLVQEWAAPEIRKREKGPWWNPWKNEVEQILYPKPLYKRVVAELVKITLLVFSVSSTACAFVFFVRSYSGLVGRILVTMDPPVTYDLGQRKPGNIQSLPQVSNAPPQILKFGSRLVLALDEREALMMRRVDKPHDATPDLSLLWKGGAAIIRARRGLLMVDEIKGPPGGGSFTMAAAGGFEYACLEIEEGRQVVVDPERLVGFSSTVRFRTHWDFSVAVVALHRSVSLIAVGPGRLIFRSSGSHRFYTSASELSLVSISSLMLFDRDAQFEINASKGFLNYYFSTCTVRPQKGDLFLAGPAPAGETNIVRKAWDFIKSIYLPI